MKTVSVANEYVTQLNKIMQRAITKQFQFEESICKHQNSNTLVTHELKAYKRHTT